MVLKEILLRRSIRSFDSRNVEDDVLQSLFEAARWAPSSFNEQPWRFILAKKQDVEQFNLMLSCVNENNREWASGAAVLIICITGLFATKSNLKNKHALYDLGLAVGNLSVQATSVNLFMRQMAGFDPLKAGIIYHIPVEYEPVSMIALGYRLDQELLSEDLRKKENYPRVRKPLNDLVFEDKFGRISAAIQSKTDV